jgi:hypothetical protein
MKPNVGVCSAVLVATLFASSAALASQRDTYPLGGKQPIQATKSAGTQSSQPAPDLSMRKPPGGDWPPGPGVVQGPSVSVDRRPCCF